MEREVYKFKQWWDRERERRKDWIDKKTLKIKTGGSKREAVWPEKNCQMSTKVAQK